MGQFACEFDVHSDRSVLYRRVDAHHGSADDPVMRIDCRRFAILHVPGLGFRDLQRRHQMIGLDHLCQHRSRLNMLPDLEWQIHQHSVDSRTDFQGVELLLLQLGQSPRLVNLVLFLSHLSVDGLLVDHQPLLFQIVSGREFVGFSFGRLVGQAGDHAEIVERLVRICLPLRLTVVCSDGSSARLLSHQIAFELYSQTLVFGFGRL